METPTKIKGSTGQPTNPLYEAIRSGDEDAFSCFYLSVFDRLVILIRRTIQDEEEARNIAQDTLIKLWEQRERIDPSQSLDGFVSRTAWNTALNYLKKKRVHERYCNEQSFTSEKIGLCADERIEADETAQLYEAAIRKMPTQRRRVFELSRNENLTYPEIAERLNISYNAVRNYMISALDDIRSAISILCIIVLFNMY